jgi:excisionase family DNA binding protein
MERLDPLLSVRSAAKPLAVAPRTLRDLVSQGKVEAVRIGGAIRIRRSTVEAIIRNGTGPARSAAPSEG